MRCTFCTRQAEHHFDDADYHFCESCGKAFREGFEKGRVYEWTYRREITRNKRNKKVKE